jgi:holliday junction DNA helicase RuvA
MISVVSGKIISNNGPEVVIMTPGGVGYKILVNASRSDRWPTGSEAQILTYMVVREDAMELFGFGSETERQLFLKLLSVSGIGPKSALHVLTLGEVDEINAGIARGDVEFLTRVSGIGKKTAERIVVELKSKMVDINDVLGGGKGKVGEVIEGLISLGYSAVDAREAVNGLPDLPAEQLIREALKRLSK